MPREPRVDRQLELGAWLYPWDAHTIGYDALADEAATLGLSNLHVAATYHPVSSWSPRSATLFDLPRGGVLFDTDPDRYSSVVPAPPLTSGRWEPELADALAAAGIGLRAWLVAMFQPWLIDHHPELALRHPAGDTDPSIMCPANPAVRSYLLELVSDLCASYDLEAVLLEGMTTPRFGYGWGRPRLLTALPDTAAELLAVCYCHSCTEQADRHGVSADDLARESLAAVADISAGGGDERARRLLEDEEHRRYRALSLEASERLVAEIAVAIGNVAPQTRLGAWMPYEPAGHAQGVRPEEVRGAVDIALTWRDVDAPAPAAQGGPTVCYTLSVTRRDHVDELHTWVEAEVVRALELGADELAIYQLGLLSPRELERIVGVVGATTSRLGAPAHR